MLLVNHVTPFLRIYNPQTGAFAEFHAGKLEIEEDDPNYTVVMAEANRNPAIAVYTTAVICERCGEPFAGKMAKADLAKHTKAAHFEDYLASKETDHVEVMQKEIKARAGYFCDVPGHESQTFPDEESLAIHAKVFHANAPVLTESGETVGAEDGGEAAPIEEIPAAHPAG